MALPFVLRSGGTGPIFRADATGHVLTYDAATAKWAGAPASGGGSGAADAFSYSLFQFPFPTIPINTWAAPNLIVAVDHAGANWTESNGMLTRTGPARLVLMQITISAAAAFASGELHVELYLDLNGTLAGTTNNESRSGRVTLANQQQVEQVSASRMLTVQPGDQIRPALRQPVVSGITPANTTAEKFVLQVTPI